MGSKGSLSSQYRSQRCNSKHAGQCMHACMHGEPRISGREGYTETEGERAQTTPALPWEEERGKCNDWRPETHPAERQTCESGTAATSRTRMCGGARVIPANHSTRGMDGLPWHGGPLDLPVS